MKKFLKMIAFLSLFFAACGAPCAFGRELPPMADKALSMDLQNASLRDVLKIFSIQSGLNFIAAQNVEDRKITLYLDKVPIREGMTKLFEANNLTYDYDEAANIYTVKYWGEPQMEMMTKIYRLKNRSVSASNLEKEKTALMSESGIGTGLKSTTSTTSGIDDTANLKDAIGQVLSKNGKMSEDKRTNSLIITDIPSRFPLIDELIAKLDIPQPMVMLEVEMLDVRKEVLDKLGVNVGSVTDTVNPLTIDWQSHKVNLLVGSMANKGAEGFLTLGSTYSLLFDYLRSQTDTRFLARPKIMTLNNETAEIGITTDSVVETKQVITAPSTAGGISQSTLEFSRATSLVLTPEGIGIFLRVTPQVNLDTNEITMVVNPKTSSAAQSPLVPKVSPDGKTTQVALDPEVRMTKSIIKLKDGETIALGGLIHKENQETLNKLPILGDLPLIGLLFRHKSTDVNVDRELIVFITPHIVKDTVNQLAKATRTGESGYALQYLSSGYKRKQEISNLLDVYEEK
ncbi:MAG: type II secretion system protein GspD [Deltaproteobacteria bacterium]